MVIDAHTHCFPDELAPRAMEVLIKNCDVQPVLDGTLGDLRASMRRSGVDRSLVMPIATRPSQAASINRWAKEITRDGLISFGSVHPMQEDLHAEIDRLVDYGIPGIKLHPDYQQFYVDDQAVIPMFRALADAGLIVLFHAGIDIGLPPPVHCPPDRLARLLDAVPNLTIIAAHMGGYRCWEDVRRLLAGRDIYFDTSYTIQDLGAEPMTELIKAHGADKVLFGTDSPWTEQSAEVASIKSLKLSSDEIEAILGGNAARLLAL